MSREWDRAEAEGRQAAADPVMDYDDNPYDDATDPVRYRGWLAGFANAREEPRIRSMFREIWEAGRE